MKAAAGAGAQRSALGAGAGRRGRVGMGGGGRARSVRAAGAGAQHSGRGGKKLQCDKMVCSCSSVHGRGRAWGRGHMQGPHTLPPLRCHAPACMGLAGGRMQGLLTLPPLREKSTPYVMSEPVMQS